MLLNKLSEKELQMINFYRAEYAMSDGSVREMAPAEEILKFWNEEKQELYRLLGNKMMYEKSVKVVLSRDALKKQMIYLTNSHYFVEKVKIYFFEQENFVIRYPFLQLFQEDTLIDNKYNGESAKIKINNTLIQLHNGAKPLKVLSKIATALNIEDYFEDFRIRHSQILNQKEISGTLVLSIHPLDYMTMSDNDSGWSSCMSWKAAGCYCRGTVEMMNSPYVLVAYLKSNDDMRLGGNYYWNNKKWRTLCIFDREYITSIKGYPYRNDELSSIAVKLLANLANENLNLDFSEETFNFNPCECLTVGTDSYVFDFETCTMYNDFENDPHSIIALSKNLPSGRYCLNYSGVENCMWCGQIDDFEECYECAEDPCGFLVCGDCYGAKYCTYCNGLVHGDLFEVDGEFICEDCYADEVNRCADDDELHLYCTKVDLYPRIDYNLNFLANKEISLYDISTETLKRFTTLGELHYGKYSTPYIAMHELTEEGLRAFGVNDKQSFINYYEEVSLNFNDYLEKRSNPSDWIKPDNWDEIVSAAEKLAEEKGLK